jgi:DNA-directed RNA polymerase subunit M/transcription elongation factor TFIIS
MRFCDQCHNILEQIFKPDGLVLKCIHCNINFEARPVDTLIEESEQTSADPNLYETLIQTCFADRANPKYEIDCPECKKKVMSRFIRIVPMLERIFVCENHHILTIQSGNVVKLGELAH